MHIEFNDSIVYVNFHLVLIKNKPLIFKLNRMQVLHTPFGSKYNVADENGRV